MRVQNLYLKAAIPTVLAVALLAIALETIGEGLKKQAMSNTAQARSIGLMTISRTMIETAMRPNRHPNLQRLLERLKQNPDVVAVRVLTPSGQVLRSSDSAEIGRRLPDHTHQDYPQGDRMLVPGASKRSSVPIIHRVEEISNHYSCRGCHGDAPIVGLLDLDVDTRPQAASLAAWQILSATLGSLQVLAVLGLTVLGLNLLVVRPARRLRAAMVQVQKGNLSVQVEPTGTRDFDMLADGFNAMVLQLRHSSNAVEEARRAQMERAEQLATVGRMAAGLAHEIRNPVSGVKAAIEVLHNDLPPEDGRRPILNESIAELRRIEKVICDLLNYARPNSPAAVVADLNQVVSDALMLVEAQAAAQKTVISRQLAAQLPPIRADVLMLRQVLVNLLLNALDATAVVPKRLVTVTTTAVDGAVSCRVRDTGLGVQAEESDQIFRPFHTTKSRGTGLGLAISRRLIELHGGQLRLENPDEPGASFVFTIPVQPDREA